MFIQPWMIQTDVVGDEIQNELQTLFIEPFFETRQSSITAEFG